MKNKSCLLYGKFSNSNSLVRDALSNERSFLAYLRTSLTLLVSAFSITQIIIQLIIQLGIVTLIENNPNKFNEFTLAFNTYKNFIRPVCLLFCSLSVFTLCIGFKRFIINFYELALFCKFKPGYIGMILIFTIVFIANVIILKICITMGIDQVGFTY
jgi:uncharacterized membrane protein YidH (DUF202 family)